MTVAATSLIDKVQTLWQLVVIGNHQPPLITQVATHEERLNNMESTVDKVDRSVSRMEKIAIAILLSTLGSVIMMLVDVILHHTGLK